MTRDEWLESYSELMVRQQELYVRMDEAIVMVPELDEEQADLNVEFALMARHAKEIIEEMKS